LIDRPPLSAPRRRALIAVIMLGGAAYTFQQTVVLPALPSLKHDLDTSTSWTTWLFTSFLLVGVVGTPILGRLADQFGKKRVTIWTFVLFLAGTVGCIAAPDIWWLIGARAVQGIGAALFPIGIAILKDELPPQRVPGAVSMAATAFGAGGLMGSTLGGPITSALGWRYMFVFGAVMVSVATVLSVFVVRESLVRAPSRVDVAGSVLLSGGLAALLLGISEGNSHGWTSTLIASLFLAAAALLAAWAAVELRVPDPMVDLRMLGRRRVLFTNLATMCGGYPPAACGILLPLLVTAPLGVGFAGSISEVSLYFVPATVPGLIGGILAARVTRRFGAKWSLALANAVFGATYLSLALAHDAPWPFALGLIGVGLGATIGLAGAGALTVDSVRPTETAIATSLNIVMRTIGSVLGAQVTAAILVGGTLAGAASPADDAFTAGFAAAALAGVIGSVLAVVVTPRRTDPQTTSIVPSLRRGAQPVVRR
jgi:MFS family permease